MEIKMILEYSIYELLWLFFIYAFLGWCIEVAWCGIGEGRFVNRGFLNGPVCPIYGAGAAAVILCLTPIKNTAALFVCSMIITSVLELITGFVLEKIFHTRWWDYSDIPFNIGGYICLKYSIYWGVVCVALMRFIHPAVYELVKKIPVALGIALLVFLCVVFITDIIITVVTINSLSKRIKLMDEIAEKIHAVSDEVGEHIYDGVSTVVKKGEEIYNSENVRELREKYAEEVKEIKEKREKSAEELKEKYASIVSESHIFQRRIIKAFPNIKSTRNNEHLEKLKEKLRRK